MFLPERFADNWTVPHKRIPFSREQAGTPAAAEFCDQLKSQSNNFIEMAQGNHTADYCRMPRRLKKTFSYAVRPNPEYQKKLIPSDIIGLQEDWERKFLGVDLGDEGSGLVIEQQGRYAIGMAFKTLWDDYYDDMDLSDIHSEVCIGPNLRWRVIDKHIPKGMRFEDYDVTAEDQVAAMKNAVRRAGGARHVGSFYLCSPNNPTGKRYTAEEYEAIYLYVEQINQERAQLGLKPAVIFCDDPYFEACRIKHTNEKRAKNGDHYIDMGYEGLNKHLGITPIMYFHSWSKFMEQAGSEGITSIISTNAELMDLYTNTLIAFGGLAHTENFQKALRKALSGGVYDRAMLQRIRQTGQMFQEHRENFDEIYGDRALKGLSNMVGCLRVKKEDFIGAQIQYANGEVVVLNDVIDLVETIGNLAGVGLVPQPDDCMVRAEGYDSENEVLLRFAFNQDPKLERQGMLRVDKALNFISDGLKHDPALGPDTGEKLLSRVLTRTDQPHAARRSFIEIPHK